MPLTGSIDGNPRTMAASSLYDPTFDPPAEVEKKGGIRLDEGPDRGRLSFSFWLALLSACLFLGAGLRVHADRTHRRPIVTWEPVGVILAIGAAAVCIAAMILALRTVGRFASVWRCPWALAALTCAAEAAALFLFFLGGLYEDKASPRLKGSLN